MLTPGSIIDALGGTGEVAELLSLSKSTVSGWRTRPGGIPAPHWVALSKLAAKRGRREITLERLAARGARNPAEARA